MKSKPERNSNKETRLSTLKKSLTSFARCLGASKQQESGKTIKRGKDLGWTGDRTEAQTIIKQGLTGNFGLQKGELPNFLCIVFLMKNIDVPVRGKLTANEDARSNNHIVINSKRRST